MIHELLQVESMTGPKLSDLSRPPWHRRCLGQRDSERAEVGESASEEEEPELYFSKR